MKILAPFDFSQESIYAVQFGAQVATETDTKLKVLHCLNLPTYSYYDSENAKSFRKLLLKDAETSVKNHLKIALGTLPEIEISHGIASSTILKKNSSEDVRYTVMGYKGQHVPDKIGSTTRDILRFARGSVFAIKKALDIKQIKNILLVTDFHKTPAPSLANVKFIQQLNDAHVTILYVNNRTNWMTTEETTRRMDEFCQVHSLQNTSLDVINDETLESGILHKLSKSKIDLVALKISQGDEKLNARETHLSAEKIIDNTDIPVMSFAHTSIYK